MPRIVSLEGATRDLAWRYVEGREEALFFQSIKYVEFLAELLGARNETVVALRDGKVCGVLPILTKEGCWGRVVNSLPFFGSHGGALADDEQTLALLTQRYNDLALRDGTAASTLIESPLAPIAGVGIAHNQTDSRIGQVTSVRFATEHESHILAQCHHKTRNMIRKARKSGVEVDVGNDQIEFLRTVHDENIAALGGIAKPAGFFDLFPRHFEADRDYRIYVARREGTPLAALLLFYFNRTVEYYMPVIRKEHRELQPMSLLVYTAMCDAAREGYWWWNWGGTWHTQDGVYRFKSRWGTVDRNYTYYVQLNRPDIAQQKKGDILEAYPYFYVLPFGKLDPQSA